MWNFSSEFNEAKICDGQVKAFLSFSYAKLCSHIVQASLFSGT